MTRAVTLLAAASASVSDAITVAKENHLTYEATAADSFNGTVKVQQGVGGGWSTIASLTATTALVTLPRVERDTSYRILYDTPRGVANTGTLSVTITDVTGAIVVDTPEELVMQSLVAEHAATTRRSAHPTETGWKDIVTDLVAKSTGAAVPSLAAFRDNVYAYSFSSTTDQELFCCFHIPHDIKAGSNVYPRIHYSNGANTNTTQDIIWKFSYMFAKGFGSPAEAFPAEQTIVLSSKGSAVQYAHLITECTDDEAITIDEPDGILLARVWRHASDGADTYPAPAFAFTADLHYQTDRSSTPNKRPDFYAE